MSCLPDTTIVQNMCGCYPPDMCEVKGQDITGQNIFVAFAKLPKLAGSALEKCCFEQKLLEMRFRVL